MSAAVPAAKRPRIPQEPLYQTPPVAWPTLLLFVLALALWSGALAAVLRGLIPPAAAILLQTVAAFMQFTVLHDGVHRSLLRGYPRLNDMLSSMAGAFLGLVGVGPAFRYAHFKHHRLTNEGDDPDRWSGNGHLLTRPLHWATADLYYGVVILHDWKSIPLQERRQMIAGVLLLVAVFGAAVALDHGWDAVLYWLLPARLAILWLAFAFNYLPHHPHQIEQRHNPYAATNVRRGGEPLMKWLFLYQNYHLIHHLFPSVPFYRYLKIWRRNEAAFTQQGTSVVPWYGLNPRNG
jgi:beta-carotene hydroxylase